MNDLGSSLGRHVPTAVMTGEEFERYRRRLWQEKRGVLLWLDEITDEFVRQGVANLAAKKFGSGGGQ